MLPAQTDNANREVSAAGADLCTHVKLLDSLLETMVRLEGDALVMHVGEKPYVVTASEATSQFRGPLAWGQVELSSRVLSVEAVNGMLAQILPIDERSALDEYGATQYEVTAKDAADRFTIVAARGGDDIWLEVRRHPKSEPASVPEPAPSAPVETPTSAEPSQAVATGPAAEPSVVADRQPEAAASGAAAAPVHPPDGTVADANVHADADMVPHAPVDPAPVKEEDTPLPDRKFVPEQELLTADSDWGDEVLTEGDLGELLRASAAALITDESAMAADAVSAGTEPNPVAATAREALPDIREELWVDDEASAATAAAAMGEPEARSDREELPLETALGASTPARAAEPDDDIAPVDEDAAEPDVPSWRPAAVVVPLTRHGRPETPADVRGGAGTLERVLRLAVARGAAAVYVIGQSAPMIRVDGEFGVLESEPALSAAAVERLTAELAPHGIDPSAPAGSESVIEVPEIGRVRCTAFRDHRGAGLIFRMVPQRAISADQLAVPAEVQALCSESDGLVLVAGGRGSGTSTLLTSFVDLINRTRSDHVITTESEVVFLHENKRSFVSQREIGGDADAMAAAVRAAAREDPDVLVIEELRTPELVTLALDGAEAGRLVFAAIPAPSAVAAIERIFEMFPPERREKMQALLAGALRGIVSQVILRKLRGGRVAAREVLLNTPAVASLILEGRTFQLPAALESGRRHGMMPLAESLATLVREGTVHPSHAYRRAPNREQFLAILRRDGLDTSIAERLA